MLSLHLVILALLPTTVGAGTGDCFNPLFQPHWAGKSDIRHLASEPTVEGSLRLCPFWAWKPACCTTSFEEEQQKAFELWKEHWKEKEQRLEAFHSEMDDFRLSPSYQDSSLFQRELFDTAILRVKRIIATYGLCFDTLLEYVAGMLCFPCQPHWHHQVLLSDDHVLRLKISEYSNDVLWDNCRPLAEAAKEFDHRVQDSLLAKKLKHVFVDFRMFYDRIRVSEYMEQIGREIMRGPNELQIKTRHQETLHYHGSFESGVSSRLLSINGTVQARHNATNATELDAQRYAEEQFGLLNPILDGQRSGFSYRVFPEGSARDANELNAMIALLAAKNPQFLKQVLHAFETADVRGVGRLHLNDIKASFATCQELIEQVELAAKNPSQSQELLLP
eukprot:symbB.v1.2.018500.t1/scaffold1403.1/size153157/6